MASISMHVLDTTSGRPAAGLDIQLEALGDDGSARALGLFTTNDDGRVPKSAHDFLTPGVYRATFQTGPWLDRHHGGGFWPVVPIVFRVSDNDAHYHVPLLLSPYGISSYRGS
jgi:5-hydroxyisourate hydrolase